MIVVEARTPPPDALTVRSPGSCAQTPNSGMRNVKRERPASSVVTNAVGVGPKDPVIGTAVFGGKFSIEQVKVTLGPVEGMVFGLQLSIGVC
jgi:hypothetical protein